MRHILGERVLIMDDGGMYTTYCKMADKMMLTNYQDGYGNGVSVIGMSGTIIAIKEDRGSTLYGVRLDNGRDIIVSGKCFARVGGEAPAPAPAPVWTTGTGTATAKKVRHKAVIEVFEEDLFHL